jgi:NAD(P)-dependent dehydrogenase (short-subunit alcohol dehydrogenase family)
VEHLLARQGWVCLICCRGNRGETWCIDHDHELAALHSHSADRGCRDCVRGILCKSCNVALGLMGDDPARLRRAADYIDIARSRK